MNIQPLQLIQQNLQNVLLQKQQIQSQLMEYASALDNLKDTEKAYQICGKIMVALPPAKLKIDLQEKKETAEIRLKNFDQQEDRLRKNLEDLQRKAVEEMDMKKK